MELYKIVTSNYKKHYYEDTDVFERYWKYHYNFWKKYRTHSSYGMCAYKCVPSVSGQSVSWQEIRKVP